MSVPIVTVTGHVVTPSGTPATGGNIVFELTKAATVIDPASSARERIGGQVVVLIGADGSLNCSLVPNDVIILDGNLSPGGTRYIARVNVSGPTRCSWSETLNVKSAPNPVAYGAIERDVLPTSLVLGRSVSKAVTIESPQAGDLLAICQLDRLISVDHVVGVIADGDPGASVTFQIQHGAAFPLNLNLWSANKVCPYGASGSSFAGPYLDETLLAGEFLGLKIVSISGSVREFNATVFYLE